MLDMVSRTFILGDSWLYLKIYTGIKTSDIILEEAICPLIKEFVDKNIICSWFFIRYRDPNPHLRIRFHLTDPKYHNIVLSEINIVLREYIISKEVHKIQLDTYTREIERYGISTIDLAEELFCKSSNLATQFLGFTDEEKITVCLFYIENILNQLHLSNEEKLVWISQYNNAFKKEFHADKNLNSQLDKKFRVFKIDYSNFLSNPDFEDYRITIEESINQCLNTLNESKEKMEHGIPLSSFFQSIFHMHINRIFVSQQRFFEMVIYDYLFRLVKGKMFVR